MDNQVTKVKSEGRVAAGKRLVEWNRKKKEDLKSTDQVPDQIPAQVPTQVNSSDDQVNSSGAPVGQVLISGVIILVGGGIALYLYTRHTTPTTPVNPSVSDNDIFRRH